MEDLSQNGSQEFSPSRSDGVRQRTALALDLGNPSEKRNRIASLSDLALNGHVSSMGVLVSGEKEKTALQTPTPTQFLFPKNVTEEQEAYASGFELALKEIYKEKGRPAALAASTGDQGLVCSEVSPIPIDIISTISESSTTSTNATAVRVSQLPFSKAVSHSSFGNSSVVSGGNSCDNYLLNFTHSTPVRIPKTETVPQQMLQCAVRGRDIISDVRSAPFDRDTYCTGHLEGPLCTLTTPNALGPSQHPGGSSDRISQAHMSADKSAAGNDVRNWVSLNASVPQIHSHGVTIPSNLNLAGPVLSHQTAVSSKATICSKSFGNALPVSDHSQNRIPVVFPAHSHAGTVLPVYEQSTGFHGYGSQRMLFSPGSTSLPVSSIYPETGLEIPVNHSWSGPPSTMEPVSRGSWVPAKGSGMAPVGVVNMDEQERMKLERKRAKNRVAAQRCQMRKLERIARLEDKAEKLREQNSKLLQTVDDLRSHIGQLKKQITAHASKGCRLMLPDVTTSANPIVSSL